MEQAHENKMTRDETLKVALMVGKILLKSGAETYRVEDTINRFCIANGYEVDIFVTPTVIILGNEQVDSFNCVSRIRYRTTNLGMISEMNDMSYKFERWPMSYRGTMAWLEEKTESTGALWQMEGLSGFCYSISFFFRRCWAATAMILLLLL